MIEFVTIMNTTQIYYVLSKYFLLIPPLVFIPYLFIDAPFGRFSPSQSSWLLFDGVKSWILMELVSPITFITTFLYSPLSGSKQLHPSIYTFFGNNGAPGVLASLFLIHYANRAILSPLRTPVRSKSHIIVPLCGISFNVVNGYLMGAFLSSLVNTSQSMFPAVGWRFWTGVGIWAVGFASNIWHDEILLDIRRQPKDNSGEKTQSSQQSKPHYAIPYGGLYRFVSYPNYLSEWVEWMGFAIAATVLTNQLPSSHPVFPFVAGRVNLGPLSDIRLIQKLTPPWLFLLSEVFLMLPRAWRGHKWYLKRFPDYPQERKAVVPLLL